MRELMCFFPSSLLKLDAWEEQVMHSVFSWWESDNYKQNLFI